MASLKDVALECGVSVATVSKALNGQQDIGETTRQRVLAVAKEMGYTVNSAARSLKTNRTYNLGILFSDLSNSGFMHEYFASTLNAFRFEAERRGYDLCFINGNAGHQKRTFLQHALYRGVDGVAIICADFLDHAYHNRTAVLSDNTEGMAALVRYAYSKGHRRIAYIHGNNTAVTESRMTGFFRGCEDVRLTVPDTMIRACEYHEPRSCYEVTRAFLQSCSQLPTCLFFPDDYAYIGGMNALAEAGLRVPEDISVAGYDGIHLAKVVSPHLTTWQQNTEDLGKIAASKLIERIENPRTSLPEHIVVQGKLLEGETIREIA